MKKSLFITSMALSLALTACNNGSSPTPPSPPPAPPAPTTQFGFDTFNYMFGAAQQAGYQTTYPTYAANAVAYDMPLILNNLAFLNANGVHVAREVVPELAMEDKTIFYPAALPVVQAYAANGFTLILALARPAAGQDLSNGQINCMIPSQWPQTATIWANTVSSFIAYLGANGVPASWLATHLLIDPYNEFDSLQTSANGACPATTDFGTPARAAQLSQAMAGLPITTPSLATGGYGTYLTAYYAAGGLGCPNVHIYYTPTEDKLATTLELLAETSATAPACKVILGEFGEPTAVSADDADGAALVKALAAAAPSYLSIAMWWDFMSPDEWATSPPNEIPDPTTLHATATAIIQAK